LNAPLRKPIVRQLPRFPWWALPIVLVQTACSVVSPSPTYELFKAAGAAASMAVSNGPSHASNTVYHLHPTLSQVCIEYNRDSQVAGLIPAMQVELKNHQIESRVFESGTSPTLCPVWLRYHAYMEWGRPPMSDNDISYLTLATLSLVTDDGRILSTSNYENAGFLGSGKWSPVRSKIAPVITALVTGFEN
jgi:hypothetical protein